MKIYVLIAIAFCYQIITSMDRNDRPNHNYLQIDGDYRIPQRYQLQQRDDDDAPTCCDVCHEIGSWCLLGYAFCTLLISDVPHAVGDICSEYSRSAPPVPVNMSGHDSRIKKN